jgi:hypothetical protein
MTEVTATVLGLLLTIVFISTTLGGLFLAAWAVLTLVDGLITRQAIRAARQELIAAGIVLFEPIEPKTGDLSHVRYSN